MNQPEIIVALGALLAGLISGLTGFGTGLAALGIWLHVIGPLTAAPLVTACSIVAQLFSLALIRPKINLPRAARFIVPGFLGVPLGAVLLLVADPAPFKIGIGLFLIATCSVLLFLAGSFTLRSTGLASDGAVGFSGGVLGGLAGLSGVLPTLYCTLQDWSKAEQRAVYQPYNLTVLVFAMAVQAYAGLVTPEFLRIFAVCIPSILVGCWIGVAAYRHVNDRFFRIIVLTLLLVSGLVLVVTNL